MRLESPLFPGYVFCRFTPHAGGLIVTTPGVVRIIGYKGIPALVEEHEISSLKGIVRSQLPVSPHPYIRVGDAVEIRGGALSGLRGVLVKIKDNLHLVVSVKMMERSVAVTLPNGSLVHRLSGGPG